jgi:hypothetical protein
MIRYIPLALLLGCSTTNLTIVELPDSGPLGEVSHDAGPTFDGGGTVDAGHDGGTTLNQEASVALDGGEGGEDAEPEAGPTWCVPPNLPPSWVPSSDCVAAQGATHDCPACLPFWYACTGGSARPLALDGGDLYVPDSGLWAGTAICSDVATCVRATTADTSCTGLQAYDCPKQPDGGPTTIGLPSLPLCQIGSSLNANATWCCQ